MSCKPNKNTARRFFGPQARQVDYKIHLEVDFTSKNNQEKNPWKKKKKVGGKLALLDIKTYCQLFFKSKMWYRCVNTQANQRVQQQI